jgi:hypothetical protein
MGKEEDAKEEPPQVSVESVRGAYLLILKRRTGGGKG